MPLPASLPHRRLAAARRHPPSHAAHAIWFRAATGSNSTGNPNGPAALYVVMRYEVIFA